MAVDGLHGDIYIGGYVGYFQSTAYILKLDSEGNLIYEWNTNQVGTPMGIALSPDDSSIYLTDSNGVKRFSYYPETFVSTKW